jgi:phage terminase small subunit
MTQFRAPKHLSKEACGIWRDLIAAYGVKDERSVHLLTLAMGQHDRMREAQRAITEYGAITRDRYGNPRQNPAVSIENRSHRTLVATLKAALRGHKPVNNVAEKSRSASVVALHEFIDRRAK